MNMPHKKHYILYPNFMLFLRNIRDAIAQSYIQRNFDLDK